MSTKLKHFLLVVILIIAFNDELSRAQQQQQQQQPLPLDPQLQGQQQQQDQRFGADSNMMQMNVYQFLKQTQQTTRFVEIIDRVAQQTGDRTVVALLKGDQIPAFNANNGINVFVPINDALNGLPNNVEHLRNEIQNLIVRGKFFLSEVLI
jgi:hypothetical protein